MSQTATDLLVAPPAPTSSLFKPRDWQVMAAALWTDLKGQVAKMKSIHLRTLMADQVRNDAMYVASGQIVLDYSRQKVDTETMSKLFELAEKAGVEQKKQQMFSGEKINETEGRAVLHAALRAPRSASIAVDGQNVVPEAVGAGR
eukprot:s4034_g5.t1